MQKIKIKIKYVENKSIPIIPHRYNVVSKFIKELRKIKNKVNKK